MTTTTYSPETAQCYKCADVVLEGTLDDEGWCEECVALAAVKGPEADSTNPTQETETMTTFPAAAITFYLNAVNDQPITDDERGAVESWCADNDLTISEMLGDITDAALRLGLKLLAAPEVA